MAVRIVTGDCRQVLAQLPEESVQTCVTSPPYFGLRDYGVDGQIGLEPSVDGYVAELVGVFREVRRVLRDDGTLWLNLGDSYAGGAGGRGDVGNDIKGTRTRSVAVGNGRLPISVPEGLKPKDLIGIPWRVAFALQADGWYLRSDIIWHKPNPMPESVTDRPTKAHEYLFLLTKQARYFYDAEAVSEPVTVTTKSGNVYVIPEEGRRNRRSVWTVATQPFKGAHFATFPPELIEPCVKAGSRAGDIVLDPFGGAGTTGLVADRLGREAILVELNLEYAELARRRIRGDAPLLAEVSA